MYEATTEEITAVDGIELDITIRGDEEKAEKVMMDLKERIGVLAAAYDFETTPEKVQNIDGGLPARYVPLMTIDWDAVFNGDCE